MRTSLGLRQQQGLALTPALRQSLRLLQLPLYELEQALANALQDNPLLLAGDGPRGDAEQVTEHDSPAEYDSVLTQTGNEAYVTARSDDGGWTSAPDQPGTRTLADELLIQLRELHLDDHASWLVACLVAELDERGYLVSPLSELAEVNWPVGVVALSDWQAALSCLQSFDPPGVGARSLAECLQIQLRRWPAPGFQRVPEAVRDTALRLAGEGLDLLAKGRWAQLRVLLSCDEQTLTAAHRLLTMLEPRPARAWGDVATAVVPELSVRRVAGVWVASLNDAALPRIRLHRSYGRVVAGLEKNAPLRAQWLHAKGLVSALHQRYATLMRVAQAAVQHQQRYFNDGDAALLPLQQATIAADLGLHESTVSRAVAHKYLQGPHGVIPLSRLFGAVRVAARVPGVERVAGHAVRHRVASLIAAEDADRPWSDAQLAALLAAEGMPVARRTVAKYRELAGLPAAALRGRRSSLA